MNGYDICTDIVEIITGTNHKLSPVYQEAAKSIEKNGNQAVKKLKGFITSIESISSKSGVSDTRISSSNGNLKNFSEYKSITTLIDFLNKHLSGSSILKDLQDIHDSLISNASLYTDAYQKNAKLITLEYENGLYILVTGLVFLMVNKIDISSKDGEVVVKTKSGEGFGVITKNIHEFSKVISSKDHKSYIEEIIKQSTNTKVSTNIKESGEMTFTEANAVSILKTIGSLWDNTLTLGKSIVSGVKIIKNSLFGIIPLIRSVLYLRYKKKADTILALEEQCVFIERNIDQLKNRSNMDPEKKKEIIKKQEAIIEAYRKKAEKLRAELTETEKDASTELKKGDEEIKNTANSSSDDDFILEGYDDELANLLKTKEEFGKNAAERRKVLNGAMHSLHDTLTSEPKETENSKRLKDINSMLEDL